MLQSMGEGIWVLDQPMRMPGGIEIGTRSAVVRLADGGLLLHCPGPLSEEQRGEVRALGPVQEILAPNAFHHLFLEEAVEHFPDARVHAVASLHAKYPDLPLQPLGGEPDPAWQGVLEQQVIAGAPRMDEVVCFHPESRTLLLVDLCFNMRRFGNRRTEWFMRLAGAHGRFGPSRLARSMIRDRAAVRASLDRVLEWDFDQVVVTHGERLERGGRDALREAFGFLRA